MGKVQFHKASDKDPDSRVTVNLGYPIDQGTEVWLKLKARHSNKAVWILFYSNRKTGRTLKTCAWPKRFAKPTVGNPVEYEVLSFEVAE